ncbi:MAG: hypothetical protein IJD04_08435, partial [Desulfovibrionaceae bacterium]|nr:hypothetical protein [Desulfovibrionaceae bacterium]
MNSIARPTIVYALGLSEASLSLIKGCQGPVETVCPDHLTDIDPLNEGALWTSLPSWLELTPEQKFQLAGTAKILVLSPSETVYDLELPGELSFAAITVEP